MERSDSLRAVSMTAATLFFAAAPAHSQSVDPKDQTTAPRPVTAGGQGVPDKKPESPVQPVISPSAAAAPAQAQVGEIIITAQKRAENLQNVPIAVSVVDANTLKSFGVSAVSELAQVAPGLTMTQAGSNSILPRIRGIGQTGANMGLENPVAVYVDGVYYASTAASMFSLNNISQIAVLKGPQGTLFGRNATGGLIQVTTRDPQLAFGGEASLTAGNKATYGGNLYLTGGLAQDVAGDVAVYYHNQAHGFGVNLANGTDVNKGKDLAVRSKVKAHLGANTTVTLSGDYSRSVLVQPVFRIAYGFLPINKQPFTGGKFDIDSDTQPYAKTKQWGTSLTIKQDLGGVSLTSISALRDVSDATALDNDGLPAPTTIFLPAAQTAVTTTAHERTFSQEFQLSSEGKGPLKWTTGLYYFQNNGHYDPPVVINQLNGLILVTINTKVKTRSYAAYGQATYALTDRFHLTAGLRYTKEVRDAAGSLAVAVAGNQVAFVPSTGHASFGKVTWRLAADYRASDNLMAYASYNRGFKSGGFNPTEIPYHSFAPEQVDAYEAGLKLDLFGRRLRFNPAAFYYNYRDLQAILYVNGQPLTQNAASAKIYGLDADLAAVLMDGLTINGGISLLHARYGLYRNAQITTPDLINGGNIISSADLRGTQLANTPKFTADIGGQYALDLGSGKLTFAANYSYNDGFYAEAENRQRQKPYQLVNASIEYRARSGYMVSLWAKNIGNVAYATQLYTERAGDKVRIAPGRTFGVTAGMRF